MPLQGKMCYVKVDHEQVVSAWEDSENGRISHNSCPEDWLVDLRRINVNLNDMSMEELINNFELFDLLGIVC